MSDATRDPAVFSERRQKAAAFLRERGLAAARIDDFERQRNPSLRYLTGHPGDAFLVLSASGECILVPWDFTMAQRMASADGILPYTSFGRSSTAAFRAVLDLLGVVPGGRVGMSSSTSYPSFVDHVGVLEEWDIVCEAEGLDSIAERMRAVKKGEELAIYDRAIALTDSLMDMIEEGVRNGALDTEIKVALFIEAEARKAGAEGTGFDTIAAGPTRSFGIHAFPSYGSGPFGTEGLSILDFGIVVDGYTTDVTMSFVRNPLTERQNTMIDLVEEAHTRGIAACGPGVAARKVAAVVDSLFSEAGFTMPHALGHGIGLEAHEAPGINMRESNTAVLEPGMIVTIEPGLYDSELGGVRLEDDVLITEGGARRLTSSRIVRL